MFRLTIFTALVLVFSGCVQKRVVFQERNSTIKTDNEVCYYFNQKRVCADRNITSFISKLNSFKGAYGANLIISLKGDSIRVNDILKMDITSDTDGYLTLISINPYGKSSVILPNAYSNGAVEINRTFHTQNQNFNILTLPPKGLHHILVIFTQKQLPASSGDIIQTLNRVKNGSFGKSYIALVPVNIY